MKIHLVVIDPQNDFCDPKNGSLYVSGADQDMLRLADMVKRLKTKIDDIHVTLDSHHPVHIAHPIFWKDSNGNRPAPFTLISADDVRNGRWMATRPSLTRRAREYVESLETHNRYQLCIWPPHCLIGTPGQNVFPPFMDALNEWTADFAYVDFVTKGSNILTEHYSAIVADVPDPADPSTQLNIGFINAVNEADLILFAGEALSHCVANTGRDCVNYFNDDSFVKKLVFLSDASSNVPGFEALGKQFVDELQARGMQVTTTKDFLA